mmetsp:Transcript_25718/g.58496  ORF Transcript_25718/g.58496 Transcript_25718/m.58496 type:complete len:268 (-) Transcript_25718:229-1032(-)
MDDASQRQQDELTVIVAMFEDRIELDESGDSVAFWVRAPEAGAVLRVDLPPHYPYEPLELSLSCPGASTSAATAALQSLKAIVHAADSEECCAQLVQAFLELAAESLAPAASSEASVAKLTTISQEEELVLRIDHMNEHASYMKQLERWATDGGLAGVLLYDDSGRRVHDVVLVLQGESRAMGAFLQQLRTELVDVDSKGRKCRERQSTVLCRRPAGTYKESYTPAERLRGWSCARYSSAAERDSLLDRIGMLHVGSGAERWAQSAR